MSAKTLAERLRDFRDFVDLEARPKLRSLLGVHPRQRDDAIGLRGARR